MRNYSHRRSVKPPVELHTNAAGRKCRRKKAGHGDVHVRKSSGFTLIELLVVIAIIALLVSILLPSLQKAKELAKSAVCQSNLHSIAVAVNLQASEREGTMPIYLNSGARTWMWFLFEGGYVENRKTFLCPTYVPDEYSQSSIDNHSWSWYGYGARAQTSHHMVDNENLWVFDSLLEMDLNETSSDFLLLGDSMDPDSRRQAGLLTYEGISGWPAIGMLHFRHNDRFANVAFVGGNCAAFTEAEYAENIFRTEDQSSNNLMGADADDNPFVCVP